MRSKLLLLSANNLGTCMSACSFLSLVSFFLCVSALLIFTFYSYLEHAILIRSSTTEVNLKLVTIKDKSFQICKASTSIDRTSTVNATTEKMIIWSKVKDCIYEVKDCLFMYMIYFSITQSSILYNINVSEFSFSKFL